ncbi:MAG: cupredoxin domain-containing protein [Nanoarchaeota archaeon]|nr:cupredoxin domain-containing protein [Nanoarchaeota archaeon]
MIKRGLLSKGQTTIAVAVLIIAMLVFILIYILSLPQEDRERLLNMSSETSEGWNGNIEEFTIEVDEFSFDPDFIKVDQGDKVTITLENDGKIPHNLVVAEYNVKTNTIEPGKKDTMSFIADEKGTFAFYCSVSGHRNAGEFGELEVE